MGWGSPWTMMQKGSQNIPSVLRFRDHVEVLLLLRISAFSSPGKPLLQAVPSLEISPSLVDCLFDRVLELYHPSPYCIFSKYSFYLRTLSIWNAVLNQKVCGKNSTKIENSEHKMYILTLTEKHLPASFHVNSFNVKVRIKNNSIDFVKLFDHYSVD